MHTAAVRQAIACPLARQLSAKANAAGSHRLARGQSTLSAHADALSSLHTGATLHASSSVSWADDAEKWLAHRRAAEYASDILTAKQLSPFVRPATARSWKDEFAAWLDAAPAVGAKLASTSYAEAARPAARLTTNTWADETETWLAHRRAAESQCDRTLVQEAVWFK